MIKTVFDCRKQFKLVMWHKLDIFEMGLFVRHLKLPEEPHNYYVLFMRLTLKAAPYFTSAFTMYEILIRIYAFFSGIPYDNRKCKTIPNYRLHASPPTGIQYPQFHII